MNLIVCDICGEKIDYSSTPKFGYLDGSAIGKHGIRFQLPLFQSPEHYTWTETDVCFRCGLELTVAFVNLKETRGAKKR